MDYFITFFKGVIVGGTMLVPGVSGGSMAMILGIYDRLITAVSSFMKDKVQYTVFLGLFACGGLGGMVFFANPILGMMERFPMVVTYFFIGAVGGGIPFILKKAELGKITVSSVIDIMIGFFVVFLLSLLPEKGMGYAGESIVIGSVMLFIAGVIAAVALVLPGISVSYMLLMLGLYHRVMEAIGSFNMSVLLPLGLGGLIGVAATTRLLEKVMATKPQVTFLIILGFVLGSVMEIFPGMPDSNELITSIAALIAGFGIIRLISEA